MMPMNRATSNSVQDWPCMLATWTAAGLGLLMVAVGAAHLVAVLAAASPIIALLAVWGPCP